jgi:hypothetical protein
MTKTERLQELFSSWKAILPPDVPFFTDGIINESEYDASPPGQKLLFIAKEPNATNHDEVFEHSFVNEWNSDTQPPDYIFAKRISEWAYGIFHKFPPYDDAMNRIPYLRKIAFMNIKKTGGIGLTPGGAIEKIISDTNYRQMVLDEIDIIDPDVIILSTSQIKETRELFAPEAQWGKSGYSVKICRWQNRRIIDFYHPSSRNVAPAAYSLLQNVYNSTAFKKLL